MILLNTLKNLLVSRSRVRPGLILMPICGLIVICLTVFLQQNSKPGGYDASVGLLQAGQWLRNTSIPSDWQPQDCSFRYYDLEDIKQCFPDGDTTIIFYGDSTVRKVFWSTAHMLDTGIREDGNVHANTHFTRHNITVHLFWDPYLNASWSRDVLLQMANSTHYIGKQAYIYASTGLWHANFDHRDRVLEGYKTSVDEFIDTVQTADPGTLGTVYMAPTMLPNFPKMDVMRNSRIKMWYLDRMHAYINQKFGYNPNAPLGSPGNDGIIYSNTTGEPLAYYVPVFNKIGLGHDLYDDVGTHYTLPGIELQVQILLNHFCNPRILKPSTFPHSQSCRVQYEQPTSTHQFMAFMMFVFCGGFVILMVVPSQRFSSQTAQSVMMAGVVSVVATLYAYVCDRTHDLNKGYNIVSWYELFALSQLLVVIAALTLSRGKAISHTAARFLTHPALNLEWKGLAIGVWLICKISGYAHDHYAGEALCQILQTTLIFAETYGFAIATMSGEVDILAFIAQLMRINVLPILLSWALNTSYYFYVMPLKVTFWTVFVFIGYGMLDGAGISSLVGKIFNRDLTNMHNHPNVVYDLLRLAVMTVGSRWFVIPLWDTFHKEVETKFAVDLYLEFWFGVCAVGLAAIVSNAPLASALGQHLARPAVKVGLMMCACLLGLFFCNLTLVSGAFQSAEHYPRSYHLFASFSFVFFYMVVRSYLLGAVKETFVYSGGLEFLGSCWMEMIVLSLHTLLAGDGTLRLYILTTGSTADSPYVQNVRRLGNFVILGSLFTIVCWRVSHAWEDLGAGGSASSTRYEVAGQSSSTASNTVSPYTLELYALQDQETGIMEVNNKREDSVVTTDVMSAGTSSSMEEDEAFKEAKLQH